MTLKLNTLYNMIRQLNIKPDMPALKRAEQTIVHYDIEAIHKSEKIFVKAVDRKAERLNLAYFFGILKRIQQEQDDLTYADYYREKYNYKQMLEMEAREQKLEEAEKLPDINMTIEVMVQSITQKHRAIRKFAMREVTEWMEQLKKSVKYIEPLRKKFMDAIAELKNISLEQKKKLQQLLESLLTDKNKEERVTQIS